MSLRRAKSSVPEAAPTVQRPAFKARSTSVGAAAVVPPPLSDAMDIAMKVKMPTMKKKEDPNKPKFMILKKVTLNATLWLTKGLDLVQSVVDISRTKDGSLHVMRRDKNALGNVTVQGMPHSVKHANLFPITVATKLHPTNERVFNVVLYGEEADGRLMVVATLRVSLVPKSLGDVEVHLVSIKGSPILSSSTGVKVDDSLVWAALSLVTAYSYDDPIFDDLKDSGLDPYFMMI